MLEQQKYDRKKVLKCHPISVGMLIIFHLYVPKFRQQWPINYIRDEYTNITNTNLYHDIICNTLVYCQNKMCSSCDCEAWFFIKQICWQGPFNSSWYCTSIFGANLRKKNVFSPIQSMKSNIFKYQYHVPYSY